MLQVNKIPSTLILGCIIAAHILLLSQTAFWPYQEFRIYPYLTSHGLVAYSQIIDQHFPGVFFFPTNLYTVGLATPFGLRAVQLMLVAITHVLIYLTVRKIAPDHSAHLFGNVLYSLMHPLYEGYVLWVDSFVAPLLLASFYVLLPVKEKPLTSLRLFIGGCFLGISLLFKQPVILTLCAVGAFIVLHKPYHRRRVYFFFGLSLPIAYLLYYINQLGIWRDFWYWTITFNSTVYPHYFFRGPTAHETILLALAIIPSISCVGYCLAHQRATGALLALYTVPLLGFLYGTWAFVHLQPFLPFASIAIAVWFIDQHRTKQYLTATAYLALVCLVTINHLHRVGRSTTVADSHYSDLIKAMRTLRAQNKTIYLSHLPPELYQLSDTVPANRLFVPDFPWYTVLLENKLAESVKLSAPAVIIRPVNDRTSTKLTAIISASYKHVSVIDGAEILLKN